jgi:hypothetical protein
MNTEIGLAIFFAFLGIVFLLYNKFAGKESKEEGGNRWFNWSIEVLIAIFFVSAFWCFIFS